jgi:large subunit ribosomal protein L24
MKLHKGDTVVVISGKDKGKTGTVEKVFPSEGRAVVVGVNIRVRHVPKTANQPGRKLTFEASINVSKLMLVDAKSGKPTRIGYQVKDGKKQRVSKLSGDVVTKAKPKTVKKTATKGAKATKGTEEAKVTKAEEAKAGAVPAKKQPFWKRVKSAVSEADVSEPARMEQDHSIPDQQLHVRKGGRGS